MNALMPILFVLALLVALPMSSEGATPVPATTLAASGQN